MSKEAPFVADGPDRLRRAIAALPSAEREEWARRLDLDPSEIEDVPQALVWWLRLAGTALVARVDRRCNLSRWPAGGHARANPVEGS